MGKTRLTKGPRREVPERKEEKDMADERKIDDSELEEVSGAGEQITHMAGDPPDSDPPAGGIDRPDEPEPGAKE
jgi:hypothetical protein